MKNILHIKGSILGEHSKSSLYGNKLIEKIKQGNDSVLIRDVVENPVTQLDMKTLGNLKNKTSKEYLEYSELISEIKSADTIVISAPMYNFTISSQLHNYFDAIVQAGETFHYESDGTQVGHLKDKKAYVVLARGGIYSTNNLTFQEDYLKMLLGFIGVKDVQFIFIEGSSMGKTIEDLNKDFEKQI